MHLTGTRKAIHDATALPWMRHGDMDPLKYGTRIDRSVGSSADSLITNALEAGRVLKAIDELPQATRDWLLYAYSIEDVPSRGLYVASDTYNMCFRGAKEKRQQRLMRLCSVAVDDYRMRVSSGRPLPGTYICERVEVQQSVWRRDGWADDMDIAQMHVGELDASGLQAVGVVVRILRGEN